MSAQMLRVVMILALIGIAVVLFERANGKIMGALKQQLPF